MRTVGDWVRRAATTFSRDRDTFMLATSLPYRDELHVQWRLGQVPQLWRTPAPLAAAVDSRRRTWTVPGDSRSEFESLARVLIPEHLPVAYLEGRPQLVDQAAGLSWPKRPRVIWTSGLHHSNEAFKVWAAEKVERGAALVIGQHGGHYGVGRWSFVQDHETSISDCYFSWGWSSAHQLKVVPVGQFKSKRPLGVRHADQLGALLVTHTMPRQSYWMYSAVVSSQWLQYLDDQFTFVAHLPPAIRAALTVRLYAEDYGWDQQLRWRDRFPALKFDDGRADIEGVIRKSRLYISTYNATTYLESFTMNVPTVIFWNPRHWELADEAVPHFEDLESVGIFHDTPESAARHVASIWEDVETWWTSPPLRAAVDRFKRRYCDLPDHLLNRVEHALRDVSAVKNRSVQV